MTDNVLPAGARSPNRNIDAQIEAGKEWAKEVADPWDPCILSLDGGGIRGYSSLLILQQLMHEIYILEQKLEQDDPIGEQLPADENDLLPCHYFDFMFGTSTGGLISIMLGRLRMTIGECLEKYRVVGHQLFGRRKSSIPFRTKYDHVPLEKAVKEIVEDRKLGRLHPWEAQVRSHRNTEVGVETSAGREAVIRSDSRLGPFSADGTKAVAKDCPADDIAQSAGAEAYPLANGLAARDDAHEMEQLTEDALARHISASTNKPKPWNPDAPRVCQSCCLTAVHNKTLILAYLLRSYPHYYDEDRPLWITSYNQGADPLEIWQVTRATSAAPFYFDMLQVLVDNELKNFKDGGLRENNPSEAALSEYQSLYFKKKSEEQLHPALLLSVGTGRADTTQDGFTMSWPGPFGHVGILRRFLEKFSVIPSLLIKYTESEGKHRSMLNYAHGENTWYKRLNVSNGLENMSLDDWVSGHYNGEVRPGGASLSRMEEATNAYLRRDVDLRYETYDSPRHMLQQAAEKLVRHRRERKKLGGEKWDVYMGKGLSEQQEKMQASYANGEARS